MTTKIRNAAQVAEQRILELTASFTNLPTPSPITTTTMPNTKTVRVPHLGGIQAAYQMPTPYNPSLPTLVMVNSFTTSSELYGFQFGNKELTDKMNLLAIELLGHGQTRVDNKGSVFERMENWTYWDTAIMNLQVLEALGVEGKVFVLGTSQGGWICVRMALLAPGRVAGIIPLGTCMDYESERTRKLGCWVRHSILLSAYWIDRVTDLVIRLGRARRPRTPHRSLDLHNPNPRLRTPGRILQLSRR